MPKPLAVSYSSAQDQRTCEQKYWYRYVLNVKPKIKRAAPELGTLLHIYLDEFYHAGLKRGFRFSTEIAEKAHKRALRKLGEEANKIKVLARLSSSLGDDDEAKALMAVPQTAIDLARAYYRVHGQKDLKKHKIVLVEDRIELPVKKGIVLPGRIDLVTKNRNGYWLWEHKSTGSIPRADSRFRDLQTLIYAVALEEIRGIKPVGVNWNYIHTRPPHQPRLLQSGELSTAKNQTTTVELLEGACKQHDLPVHRYRPFMRRVEARERSEMFPRFHLPISPSENILMCDYVHTVEDIEVMRSDKNYVPIRNIDAHCNWCGYLKLCQAVILGGDTDVLMRKYFSSGEPQERGGENGQEDEIDALLEA